MPTVGRYGQRKVTTDALPGVRKTAATTAAAEGAGVAIAKGKAGSARALGDAQRADALGQFGAQAAGVGLQLYQQERDRADTVAIMEAERKLGEWENRRLYDPAQGALTVKGKAAMPLPEAVASEFNTLTGELEAGLKTPRQRAAFERVKKTRGLSLDATLRRHVFGEMQRYQTEELTALIENGQTLAVQNAMDPRRVGEELDRMKSAIRASGPQLGLGPEQIKMQLENVTSATHVGVIDRLLANEQTKAAEIYFSEAKDEISGDRIAQIEKALEEGSLRGASQKAADAIIAAGGTLTQQREKVRGIEDPELRDAVQQRVEHDAAIREREDRERSEATLQSAYDVVDQQRDVRAISPAVWTSLPGSARSALRSYATSLAKGTPIQTDLPTYYALMQQASDDPAMFTSQNLLNYRHKLDEAEFKQIAGLQLSIRTGQRTAADKVLDDYRTETGVINDALSLAGIDPTPKEGDKEGAKRVARFRGLVATEVRRVQSVTGKKATNEDVEAISQRILSRQIVESGWFFDSTKSLGEASIEDVPSADRVQIESSLRNHGRPVTEDSVLDVWMQSQIRKGN